MGVVYLARDPDLHRRVALKTIALPPGLPAADRKRFLERFKREARAAGGLSHAGIVTIYGIEDCDDSDSPIIAMEFVPGRNLQEIQSAGERLDVLRVLQIGDVLADALQEAHRAGIVHRDVKPANVLMRDNDGSVKIADFGVARLAAVELTREGAICGSPAYMAPEQLRRGEASPRSDLYSLAVILYELLTGERLFRGDDLAAITYQIVNESPAPICDLVPGLPESANRFFQRALAKEPSDRFADGSALRRGLDDIRFDMQMAQVGTSGSIDLSQPEPTTATDETVVWFREHRRQLAIAGAAVLGLAAIFGLAALSSGQAAGNDELLQTEVGEPSAAIADMIKAPGGDRDPAPVSKPGSRPGEAADPGAESPPLDARAAELPTPSDSPPLPARKQPVPAQADPPAQADRAAARTPAGEGDSTKSVSAPGTTTNDTPDTTELLIAGAAVPVALPTATPPPGSHPVTGEPLRDAALVADAAVEIDETPATPELPPPAFLLLVGKSSIKNGSLRLLVDGEEVYQRDLHGEGVKLGSLFKRNAKGSDDFEERIPISPGPHEVVARLVIEGKSKEYGSSVAVNLASGEIRELRLVAGRALGSPLAIRLP